MTVMPYDYTTMNVAHLFRCPLIEQLPPDQHLQQNPGIDCFLHPAGYPTYFGRRILDYSDMTANDDVVILDPLGKMRLVGQYSEHFAEEMHALWIPLPLDHIRTVFWMRQCYLELYGCIWYDGKLLREVDFINHHELRPYHAATMQIKVYYPHYQQHSEWVDYYPGYEHPLERGFEWRGKWVSCLDEHQHEIVHGWERFRLREFEGRKQGD